MNNKDVERFCEELKRNKVSVEGLDLENSEIITVSYGKVRMADIERIHNYLKNMFPDKKIVTIPKDFELKPQKKEHIEKLIDALKESIR